MYKILFQKLWTLIIPIVVIDEDKRIKGIILRVNVLASLIDENGNGNEADAIEK